MKKTLFAVSALLLALLTACSKPTGKPPVSSSAESESFPRETAPYTVADTTGVCPISTDTTGPDVTRPVDSSRPPEETTGPAPDTTGLPETDPPPVIRPPEETTAPPEETTAPPEETTAPPETTTAPPETDGRADGGAAEAEPAVFERADKVQPAEVELDVIGKIQQQRLIKAEPLMAEGAERPELIRIKPREQLQDPFLGLVAVGPFGNPVAVVLDLSLAEFLKHGGHGS